MESRLTARSTDIELDYDRARATVPKISPFVLILVLKLGGSLATDVPNSATCEGAAQFARKQENVSTAFCIDRRSQFYRRDKSKP